MMRHCDGRDPYVLDPAGQPCACGSRFDDVERMVTYPHAAIWTQEMKARIIDSVANALGMPPPDDPTWWHGETDDRMDIVRDAIERARDTDEPR